MKDLIDIAYKNGISEIKDTDSEDVKKTLKEKAALAVYKEVWKEIQHMTFEDFCQKKPSVGFVKDKKAWEIKITLL